MNCWYDDYALHGASYFLEDHKENQTTTESSFTLCPRSSKGSYDILFLRGQTGTKEFFYHKRNNFSSSHPPTGRLTCFAEELHKALYEMNTVYNNTANKVYSLHYYKLDVVNDNIVSNKPKDTSSYIFYVYSSSERIVATSCIFVSNSFPYLSTGTFSQSDCLFHDCSFSNNPSVFTETAKAHPHTHTCHYFTDWQCITNPKIEVKTLVFSPIKRYRLFRGHLHAFVLDD